MPARLRRRAGRLDELRRSLRDQALRYATAILRLSPRRMPPHLKTVHAGLTLCRVRSHSCRRHLGTLMEFWTSAGAGCQITRDLFQPLACFAAHAGRRRIQESAYRKPVLRQWLRRRWQDFPSRALRWPAAIDYVGSACPCFYQHASTLSTCSCCRRRMVCRKRRRIRVTRSARSRWAISRRRSFPTWMRPSERGLSSC